MNPLSSTPASTGNALAKSSPPPEFGTPSITIIGPPDAGKSALRATLHAVAMSQARWDTAIEFPNQTDGILYLVDSTLEPAVLEERLQHLANELRQVVIARGRRCEVTGLPVFLILTKCDLLAKPDDKYAGWLERIEALKLEVSQRLQESLSGAAGQETFGSLRIRVWATATQRPALDTAPPTSGNPFGITELGSQVVSAAAEYRLRGFRQPWRLQLVVWSVGLVLAAMIGASLYMGLALLPSVPHEASVESPNLEQEVRDLHDRILRLIGFEGYFRYSHVFGRSYWDLQQWNEAVTQVWREFAILSAETRKDQGVRIRFDELELALQDLHLIRDQAALCGLIEVPDRPAVLKIVPEKFTADSIQAHLTQLKRFYPALETGRPAPVPGGVSVLIKSIARVNRAFLLEFARAEIDQQFRKLSPDGKETRAAWKKLADGWLATEAAHELQEWSELERFLARLEGNLPAPEPLVQLAGFLRRDTFDLPLARAELRWQPPLGMDKPNPQDLRPAGPIVIRVRSTSGAEETFSLAAEQRLDPPLGKPDGFVFLGKKPWLVLAPGDQVAAELKLVDKQGTKWVLTWSTIESPSTIYTFNVLAQAPRLHLETEPDATKGEMAFGLILSNPQAFKLPELFPR